MGGVVLFRPTVSCRAEVLLSGFDVQNILEADPVAHVTMEAPDEPQALARFMGMCVVAMLRNATHTPGITEPFADCGAEVAAQLANPPEGGEYDSFCIADALRPEDPVAAIEAEAAVAEIMGRDISMASMLTIKFPRLSNETRPGKRRRLRVKLCEGKAPYVALTSRNAMIAADGVLCMFEHIAHKYPGPSVQHVGAVCERIFELHEETSGSDAPLSFSEATDLYRIAELLAYSDEPSEFAREPG